MDRSQKAATVESLNGLFAESGAVVVAHAGWMLARRWVHEHGQGTVPADAGQWPAPPAYGVCWRLP